METGEKKKLMTRDAWGSSSGVAMVLASGISTGGGDPSVLDANYPPN